MKTFLQYVAEDLLRKHGTDLSRIAVVFPNKRASLFLNQHLAQLSDRPLWSPAYITISDLFRRHSKRRVADPIKLVCDLYKCFIRQTGIDETLDHFYGWGQLLLSDFDDIDKNMADADRVFANTRDLHELDDIDYLTDEQREVIRRFFSNFSDDHNSELKRRFLSLWSHIADIYHDFNATLASQNLAYEGALYREVAERDDLDFQYDTYVFVGFNMIQRVEQRLFSMLKSQGRALFYWDFDRYYMKNSANEAGHYVAQYLPQFPNELDTSDEAIYDNFRRPKDITVASATTENIQARFISQWLKERGRIADGQRTAIVLCNEQLLQTVIHCLPEETDKVNITTGYPLVQSPAASLVQQLINLQTQGYAQNRRRWRLRQVNAVLRHPYAIYISPEADNLKKRLNDEKIYYAAQEQVAIDEGTQLLFHRIEGALFANFNAQLLQWLIDIVRRVAVSADDDSPLFQESLFRVYTLLNRLHQLVESGDLSVDIVTMERLIMQLIQSTSVPFHGEPAEGLQIMGVLETRNLDFDHVLILSANEGNMPKGVNDTSFIPYSIRKAHSLTTIDNKVSIYSYYFHRLLQRAGDVTIVYNNSTVNGQKGEMSRFILQILAESGQKIKMATLQAPLSIARSETTDIEKTPDIMDTLMSRFDIHRQQKVDSNFALLTPKAINLYMRCQLQFYYYYVCKLRQPDETDEDTIDNRIFGNIFHEAARLLYANITAQGDIIRRDTLEALKRSKVEIERAVDEAMRKELFMLKNTMPQQSWAKMELNGLQIINRAVIIRYLNQLLDIDSRLAPFSIKGVECDVIAPLSIDCGTVHLDTTIGGRIDRLDCISDRQTGTQCLRVIDYKTGSSPLKSLPDVDAIFTTDDTAAHTDYYLQTFLYGCLVSRSPLYNPQSLGVRPALLFIQHAGADDFDPVLKFGKEPIADVATDSSRFMDLLHDQISMMFNPAVPFSPTTNRTRCQWCPFAQICHRA